MDEKATMGQSLRSTEDEETIDLMELARLLWAHAVQIVAAAVAAALICLLVCVFALTPKYQASINMIVNTRQDNSSTFTSDNFNSAKNLISTYAVIIKGNTVLNEVIDKLDLDMTYTELYDMVDVADVDATQIMKITVTDTDAERAGEIAQTIADIRARRAGGKGGSRFLQGGERCDHRSQQGVPPRLRSTLCWPACWVLCWCAAFWCWHICCMIPLWMTKMFRRSSACPCWA